MSCANAMLTVAAVVAFLFGAWPRFGGAAAPWIVGIAALAIIVIAWTSVTCKWCANAPAAKAVPSKK